MTCDNKNKFYIKKTNSIIGCFKKQNVGKYKSQFIKQNSLILIQYCHFTIALSINWIDDFNLW